MSSTYSDHASVGEPSEPDVEEENWVMVSHDEAEGSSIGPSRLPPPATTDKPIVATTLDLYGDSES
jgi:hypothetical protein